MPFFARSLGMVHHLPSISLALLWALCDDQMPRGDLSGANGGRIWTGEEKASRFEGQGQGLPQRLARLQDCSPGGDS